MFNDPEIIALILIFVGVIFRMAIPYLRKMRDAEKNSEPFSFMYRYLIAALFALMVAVMTAFLGFQMYTIPEDTTQLAFYVGAIIHGYGMNSVIIEVMENTYGKP